MRNIVVLLLLAGSAQAQPVYIQPQNRVPNSPHGCCGRVVLATVAAHQGRPMTGYVEQYQVKPFEAPRVMEPGCPATRPHPCWSSLPGLQADAQRHGFKTEMRSGGDRSLFDRGRPVIINYGPERRCEGGHVVAYVGNGQVYDPNYQQYQPVKWHLWGGESLILK